MLIELVIETIEASLEWPIGVTVMQVLSQIQLVVHKIMPEATVFQRLLQPTSGTTADKGQKALK